MTWLYFFIGPRIVFLEIQPKKPPQSHEESFTDLKMATVTHFAPKTSESHDTRETSNVKTAADHRLLNASV